VFQGAGPEGVGGGANFAPRKQTTVGTWDVELKYLAETETRRERCGVCTQISIL